LSTFGIAAVTKAIANTLNGQGAIGKQVFG